MTDQNVKSEVSILSLAKSLLLNEAGEQVKIIDLWQKQTTMFVFLRHFGCASCKAHATQIWKDKEKYQSTGAKIIFIGNGQPNFIKGFKDELNIKDAEIYTDPSLEIFKAAGFKKGFLAVIGPSALINQIKPMVNGFHHSPNKNNGNIWQLGGILVMKPNGQVAYHYISQITGDYPPENDVLAT